MADCLKKHYLTWQHAANDARVLRRKDDIANTGVYRCKVCRAWHVGNEGRGKHKNNRRPRMTHDDE